MQSDTGISTEDRNWAMGAHLWSAANILSGHALAWLGPLVIWLYKRNSSRFIAFHSLQTLLFTLVWAGILIVGWCITLALTFLVVGILLWPVMFALHLVPAVFNIIGTIKAANGEWYEYPIVGRWALNNV